MDIVTVFRRSARRYPDRRFAFDARTSVTYGEAEVRTDAIAAELIARGVDQQIGAVVVHVAALDDIIAAKEHAGRDKDQAALPELRNLLRES